MNAWNFKACAGSHIQFGTAVPVCVMAGTITFVVTISLMIILDRIVFYFGKKKADHTPSDDEE